MSEAKILLTAEDRTRAAFESAKGSLKSVASFADAAGFSLAALGSAATVAGLVSMVKRINDSVDGFNDLADATGASIENISALDRVARMTGTNIDTVSQALIKYNQALGTTLKPGSDAEKVLGAIGLNAKALRDLDPAEALRQTAVALAQYADDGNKARAVQELFGKSLKEVAPFLKDLAEQGGLVATVTTEQALEAEKLNKELFKLETHVYDVGRAMALELVPRINEIIERYKEARKETVQFGDANLTALRKMIPLLSVVMDVTSARLQSPAPPRAVGVDLVGDALTRRRGALPTVALPPEVDKEAIAAAKRAAAEAAAARKRAAAEAIREAEEQRRRDFAVIELRNKLVEEGAKREAKALAELAKTMEDYAEANAKGVAEAIAAANQAEQDIENWGKLRSEIESVTLAQLEQAREVAALAGEDVSNIEKRIEAHKRLVAAYRTGEIRDAAKKVADETNEAIRSANLQLSQSLTDALMRGGKNGADYIEDLFRTLVLRPLLQPVGNAMAGAIGQLPGAGGGSGMLGQVGQMAGMANFTGMSLANSAGSMFANVTGGGLDALLATNGAFGTAAGGAGIMGTLGSALPWVGGALAIASMLESPRGGPKTIGGAADAATIQATVAATLATFGVSASGLRVGGFSAADPQGDSLTQLQTALFQGDRALYSRQERLGDAGYENVGRSSEELAAAWAEEQSRIMLAALQATLEPKYQQYMAGVSADASALDDINAALARVTQARTLEERLLELSSSEAENLARARQRELDAMDASLRPLAEQIWALEDAAKAATTSLTDMRADIISYAASLEGNAMAALERAISAERATLAAARSAAQESVGTLRSVFDALAGGARDLYGQVATTRTAAGIQGGAFIAQALATAHASGYLPDGDQLNQAIGAARAGIDGRQYRTVKDREFAQLVLAGQLSQLKDISGDQLTEAERTLQTAEDQLRTLEKTYDTAKAQLDAIRGVDTSIMTLAQALAAFQGGIAGAANVRRAGGADVISGADISAWVAPRLGVSEAANRALYDDALANRDRGVTLDKIDAAAGLAPGTSAAWAIANGLTPFEVGTNYVPMDMPAWLHEGEAVVPKRYNPAAGGAGAEAADLMNRLDKRFEQMDKRLAAIERSTLRTADAANGRPEQPMPVEVIA